MTELIQDTLNILSSIVGATPTFATIAGIWAAYKYFDTRKREQDLKEFEIYHKLIKELVHGDSDGVYLDRQAAIVFELTKYKRYYEFTKRTLDGLKTKWSNQDGKFKRLLDEIDITLSFLEKEIDGFRK